MTWNTWKAALTIGAVLATAGVSSAQDQDTLQLGGEPTGITMTLGGQGTAADAATQDTELTHGYRKYGGYYGGYGNYYGYRGGYGGYYGGYRGGYGGYGRYYGGYGGYGRYYGGYNSFYFSYRPAYYNYYRPYYYRPYYSNYYYPGYGSGFYFGFRISGDADALNTLTVPLGSAKPVAQPTQPIAPGNNPFRYDGGPANPIPLPAPDTKPMPPASPPGANDLPISIAPKKTTSKFKAYGER